MFIERFRTTVRSEMPPPVEFYEEFLDFDRFPAPRRWPLLARYFNDKYNGFRFDLILCVGSVALRFATQQLDELFPRVPVVFGMTFAHQVNVSDLPEHVTGRMFTVPLRETLTMARRLQPDADRVVVIAGSSAVDSVTLRGALSDLGPLGDTLRLDVRQGWPFDTLVASLRQLSRRSIVFFAHFRRDGRGQLFVPLDALSTIARESRAPVYGYVDKMIGSGVLGGAMLRQDDEAVHIGRLAVRILRRSAVEPIPPVQFAATPFMVDWRQLDRWGLDAGQLPPGAEILFRTPSAWERYRGAILPGLGIITAQSLLIGWLLLERGKRKRAQAALAEQAQYERTIAELTTDAVRHAPEDAPRALEDALSRLAKYAGAHAALLVQYSDLPSRPATRLYWTRESGSVNGNGGAYAAPKLDSVGVTRLELPLTAGGQAVGLLELFRPRDEGPWQPEVVARLAAAGELIAGAIARSSATVAADEALRQVAHLGRVATVGELVAAIAHELRQPLTAIRSNAEVGSQLLGKPQPDVDEASQLFDEIAADDRRATDVIDHIRLLLRKQEPRITSVDLNEICLEAVLLLQRDARSRGVKLRLALEPGVPAVRANAVEMQQVVLNIALNAFDALARSTGERNVVIGTTLENGSVVLFVKDNGPGLRPEVEPRLFEPFFSTKPQGLGVGLPIVRSIVQRHRGRVIAENDPSGGAVFRVVLPAADRSSRVVNVAD